MKKQLLILSFVWLFLGLNIGNAQISTSLFFYPPYPTNLDAYTDMLSEGVVQIDNSTSNPIDVYFQVSFTEARGKIRIESNGALSVPMTIQPGTTILTPNEIEDLFSGISDNEFSVEGLSPAERDAILISRQIPEGTYTLCLKPYDINGAPLFNSSDNPCTTFDVSFAERPVILSPWNEDVVVTPDFINLSWDHNISQITAMDRIEYVVKLIDLTEQEITNVQDAMLNSGVSPEFEENVGNVKIKSILNNFDLPLMVGHKYALRISAIDPDGTLAFKYGGHSEIVTFTFAPPSLDDELGDLAEIPSPQFEVPETGYLDILETPYAIPVTWGHKLSEEDSIALFETLTYTIKVIDMDSLKIPSIKQSFFEDDKYPYVWEETVTVKEMVLVSDKTHILTKGNKYAIAISVESTDDRVNFENDGYGEIVTFTIGKEPIKKDPEEACGNTCVVALPTDQVSTEMKKGKTYKIGGLKLTTDEVTGDVSSGYNGKGTIAVNFMKKIKIEVEFKGIQVNKSSEVFAGVANAVYDETLAKSDGLVAVGAGNLNIDAEAAKGLSTALRASGKLVSALKGKSVSLPLGFDRDVGDDKMIVGITQMIITPKKASLTALFSIDNPEWGDYVPTLGATDICFSESGFGQVVKLYLGEDYTIPMSNDKLKLISSADNKPEEQGTYCVIDCNGFKEGQITAEIGISREVLLPEDENGNIMEEGNAVVRLHGTFFKGKDFLLSAHISPCQIPGLEGFSFTMQNGYYDASDEINPEGIEFPEGYDSKSTATTWRGVWFSNVLLKAPQSWGLAGESERTTVGIRNFIKDDAGVSIVGTASNLLSIEKGNFEGFAISINEIKLNIIRNEFKNVKMTGNIGLPILKEGDYLDYEGLVDRQEIKEQGVSIKQTAMSFSVSPNKDGYDLDWIKSHLDFDESSEFVLKNDSKEKGLMVKLSGQLTLNSSIGTLNDNRDAGMPEMKMPGIRFEGMEISKMKSLVESNKNNSSSTNSSTNKTNKNGAFKFVRPTFSFLGIDLNEVKGASTLNDTLGKDWEAKEDPNTDPKVNGFSYNLTALDLSFGEGNGEQEITNGALATLSIAGEVSLVKGKSGGTNQKKEGLAISASGGFKIISNVNIDGTKTTLKFNKFAMDSLVVDAQVSAIGIKGKILFYNEDPTFGDGALGAVSIELPILSVGIDARFGTKDDYNYWYLFGNVLGGSPEKPVPLATFYNIISIYGFNGGAYYHMTDKGGLDPATRYVPDKSTLLGLEAGLTLAVSRPEVIWGNVTLGAEFQTGGIGLSMLKLRGDAYILKGDMKQRGAGDEVQGLEARLDAKLNLKDLDNISLTADLKVFANVAAGAVVGNMKGGEKYQMVQANLNIDKNDWYVHMGSPDKRASIRMGIPGLDVGVTAQAYLMMGNTQMPVARMPKRIRDLLGKSNDDFEGGTSSIANTRNGGGFIMGASLEYELDIKASILYANFYAGFGFDLSLTNFENVACSNNNGKALGMDGWYAQGQVYAGLSGDIGLDIDIAIYEGRISLANLSAVMALKGGFPNPVYATGRARMNYSVLGGIIEGSTSFGIDLGKKCTPEIVDPFAGISFIAGMSPPENKTSRNVSPFVQPKVSFNQKIGRYTFYTPTENGRKANWFEVRVEYFRVKDAYGKVVSSGSYSKLSDLEYAWKSTQYLSPYKMYKAEIKLKCMKWNGGRWEVVKGKDGKPWSEYKSTTFYTGALPQRITLNNVKITYPFLNERNYLHGNNYFKTGLVKLQSGVDYLWRTQSKSTDEWRDEIKVKFYKGNTNTLVSTNTFRDLTGPVIEFYMPNSLEKNTVYRIEIVRTYTRNTNYRNTESSVGNITRVNYSTQSGYRINRDGKTYSSYNSKKPSDIVLFKYHFATSKYHSIREKLNPNKTHKLSWVRDRRNDWRQITYDFKANEGFGKAELSSQNIAASNTKNKGKLVFTENRNNAYYNYMLDEYCTNLRGLLLYYGIAQVMLNGHIWRTARIKNPYQFTRFIQSYNNVVDGKYGGGYQGFTTFFGEMYQAAGYSSNPKTAMASIYPSFRTLLNKSSSKSYLWGSETRSLGLGEVRQGKYSGRYDGSQLHSIVPGYLYVGGEVASFMWYSLQMQHDLLLSGSDVTKKTKALYDNKAKWDPKHRDWSYTTFSVRAVYTNPENPNRSGKSSYSYSYTINFRH